MIARLNKTVVIVVGSVSLSEIDVCRFMDLVGVRYNYCDLVVLVINGFNGVI